MTQHDQTHICNPITMRELLKICTSDEEYVAYAKVVSEHQITPAVGTADGVRTELIRHVFSGGCSLQRGPGCKSVVSGAGWPQSVAIKLIDLTCQWVDEDELTTSDLQAICRGLGLRPGKTHQRRSLLSKLAVRRQSLVGALDTAALSITETMQTLGSSSKLDAVRATCTAHDVPVDQTETKGSLVDRMIEHITRGECAEGLAPGCDRVLKDASPSVQDVVHAQLSVLQVIEDGLSSSQLRRVLDLHGVDYGEDDNKKKLRSRLRTYTRQLRNGKVREADTERELAAKLQKLEEVRKSWPRLIPSRMKEKLVRDFKEATASQALASFTCACCACEKLLKERQCKDHTEVNIEVLRGPNVHWNDDGIRPPPTPISTGPWANALLDVNGVKANDDGTGHLELCTTCLRSLRRGSMPKHALANRLYPGPVPDELNDLTMVEECMIARARAKSWIVKLQETESGSASPTSQRGLKGHTIIYPQQPDKLATVLPPAVGETLTFICIIFVGSSSLTKEWLRNSAKPLVVRREKVRTALMWLKANNPLYKDVNIHEENLHALPEEDVLPYHIEYIAPDDAQETLVSRYDNGPENTEASVGQNQFESVVITDVDAHTPPAQLRAAAIRHVKTKGKPFVQISHGSRPVNEFFNVNLFPMLYPTLFPYGCGGFEDGKRQKRISLKEHVKWLFSLRDRRFQTHYSFLFTVFNILQRRSLLLHSSLKVRKASFSRFARDFSSVSSAAIGEVLAQVESGERVVGQTDEQRRAIRLMKEVNLVNAKVPGSSASRVAMRNEIRALTMTHGMPSFYITVNPADTHNPVVKFLSEGEIDIDNMLKEQVPKFWDQALLVSSNPAIGAKFFNLYLKAFLRVVLGYDGDGPNIDGGILGTVKAHYGCVEAQGRGSLHCHMLVWIEGALNPDDIRKKVVEDQSWGEKLLGYLDDTITNVVPEDPLPDVESPLDEKDPCTLRGANLDNENVQQRLGLRMKDVHRLAERVQRHRHTHTCYKYYKPGEERTCRFDLKEENFKAESSIDPETGNVCLRCLDGLVNNFNATILEAVRCNMDIQFIGSGESAKAMIYYITDYITKSQLKSHVAYAALQLAVKKCELVEGDDDDFTVKSKRLLQKCAYALISHQEMSAQQVVSYLMDYEDHFTSHEFGLLFWASFERFVNHSDPLPVCDQAAERTGESRDDDESSEVEIEEGVDERGSGWPSSEVLGGEDEEEEVSITVDRDGEVAELADQVSDYVWRPEEMSELCLWDVVAKTEKVSGQGTAGGAGSPGDDVCEGEDEGSDDASSGEELEVDNGKKRGRRPVMRYGFTGEHRERGRKYVRVRKREVVPVPIGPSIPRRDQPEIYERYCRLMLILFKPWRSPADLRAGDNCWSVSFEEFLGTMSVEHRNVIENMQVLHECRDSRDDHMQTRSRQREKGRARVFDGDRTAGNEMEDFDMSEVLEHLAEIQRMSSNKTEALNHETQQCLEELERAGWYDMGSSGSARCGDSGKPDVLDVSGGDSLEDEWKHTYETRKATWKLEAKQTDDIHEAAGSVDVVQVDDTEMMVEGDTLVNDIRSADDPPAQVIDALAAMDQTVQKWTLNMEQKRAFEIVARHVAEEKPDQLLMYLGGPGGTGKSRVVNALRDFFSLRGETRRFRLAAYTGVAARNIGGATLHALLQMNGSKRTASAKTKRDLAAMWDGVDYLFVDEISMIGCEMLHNVSSALTEAKGRTSAFGGVHVIFAGDFAQLPPIGDTRLYKNIDTRTVAMGSSNRAQAKVLGRLLWLSVETVVMLHEMMRQSGSDKARFVDLLQRLRNGMCTPEDHAVLINRTLAKMTAPVDDMWRSAPVIVTSNAVRDAINVRATEAFADRTGGELHWYHAVDTHKRTVITDAALIENLEGQHSGETKHRLRRVPLVVGMPVAVNQNFDVRAGVVNGSWGCLRCIRFSTDVEGRRHLKSCIVEIPEADTVKMPHLPERHFPILPDTTDITFEHGASRKRCVIKRRQVPIEPGFAVTAHKSQGQTMDRVVVDLAGCSGTEQPYVMVSRSSSLSGLVVLRDFDPGQITKRRSEDLRKEFARLEELKLRTIVRYGQGSRDIEVQETRVGGVSSKRKRTGEGDESRKRVK